MPARSVPTRALLTLLSMVMIAGSSTGCSRDEDSGAPARPAEQVAADPCTGADGVGTEVPPGLGPGDLVRAVDLTPTASSPSGFPTGARVWRILYVSAGVDEDHLQLVCGLAAAPETGPRSFDGPTGRMVAWSHGTVGVEASCLPASDPAKLFWAKTPGGIGAVAWSTLLDKRDGRPEAGVLQHALDQGWVVAATDYQPQTYVLGTIAAANVLDANRATAQLLAEEFPSGPSGYDFVTWGHSQGGHSALWAGQLAEPYLARTHPSKPTPDLHLVGVAAVAPASNFIVQPDRQPGVALGTGLTDWEMHQTIEIVDLPIPIPALEVQIGPALFSYIFGSWGAVSAGPQPAADAAFPAFPADAPLTEAALITATGRATVDEVLPLCLTGSDARKIQDAVGRYRHARKNQMLVPEVWNLPNPYATGQYVHGGTDRACATATAATDPGLDAWCRWIRWNLPGPNGDNPYPKAPIVSGRPVPMLIAQGEADTIIHCVAPKGSARADVPSAADCMSRALYDSLATSTYCPPDGDVGHLELDLFRKSGASSPATHFSVAGQIAAKGADRAGLAFAGSPLERFMTSAFEGTSTPGCRARVLNA